MDDWHEGVSVPDLQCENIVFSEQYVALILKDVLKGLEFIHKKGINHMEINGDNIIITNTGHAKISTANILSNLQLENFGLGNYERATRGDYTPVPCWKSPEGILCYSSLNDLSRTSEWYCWNRGKQITVVTQ